MGVTWNGMESGALANQPQVMPQPKASPKVEPRTGFLAAGRADVVFLLLLSLHMFVESKVFLKNQSDHLRMFILLCQNQQDITKPFRRPLKD